MCKNLKHENVFSTDVLSKFDKSNTYDSSIVETGHFLDLKFDREQYYSSGPIILFICFGTFALFVQTVALDSKKNEFRANKE